MDLKGECQLSFYEELSPMDADMTLVKGKMDEKLYLKKRLHQYNLSLYTALQAHHHPGLPKIQDLVEDGDTLVVIEEYINGNTLEFLLNQRGRFTAHEVCTIAMDLCEILHHLHSLTPPIIHRDLKLSNIMMQGNSVKLIDFDVSRFHQKGAGSDTTVLGTAGYAPPEQYGFLQTDPRSDIYSLGIAMRVMLTGSPTGELPMGSGLATVIQKCTQFSPADRYQSVQVLRQDLHKQRSAPASAVGKVRSSWTPPGFRTGRVWKMIVAMPVYAYLIYHFFQIGAGEPLTLKLAVNRVLALSYFLSLLALYTNYRNLHAHLPLCESSRSGVKAWGIVVFTLLFTLILMGVGLILDSIIPGGILQTN